MGNSIYRLCVRSYDLAFVFSVTQPDVLVCYPDIRLLERKNEKAFYRLTQYSAVSLFTAQRFKSFAIMLVLLNIC